MQAGFLFRQAWFVWSWRAHPVKAAGGVEAEAAFANFERAGKPDPKFMKAVTANPDLETIVRSGVSITLKKK